MTTAPAIAARAVLERNGAGYSGVLDYFNIPLPVEVRKVADGVELVVYWPAKVPPP